LSRPRFLRFVPPGYDLGERQQFRIVNARAVKLTEYEVAPECLTEEQVAAVVGAMPRLRDRFLVMALAETGVRIGEALGLRREDMHLLSSSKALNCSIEGPHLHIRRS
jgi:integrase/recombinase XerD